MGRGQSLTRPVRLVGWAEQRIAEPPPAERLLKGQEGGGEETRNVSHTNGLLLNR